MEAQQEAQMEAATKRSERTATRRGDAESSSAKRRPKRQIPISKQDTDRQRMRRRQHCYLRKKPSLPRRHDHPPLALSLLPRPPLLLLLLLALLHPVALLPSLPLHRPL